MDFSIPNFNLSGSNSQPNYGSLTSYGQPANANPTWGALTGGDNTGLSGGVTPLTGSAAGTLGFNIPTLQLGIGGLQSLAGLYTGLKSLSLSKDAFNLQKQMATKNLANSTASYNTALSDRATSRGVAEGQTPEQVQAYLNANKLST